jgi:hypothetical protein
MKITTATIHRNIMYRSSMSCAADPLALMFLVGWHV